MGLADTLTRGIATAKRTTAQFLQPVEWLRRTGEKDERGRQAVTVTMIDVLIEQRPQLDRGQGRITDRTDDTVLTLLDPLAITDSDTFRWGEPPHTYKVSKIDGVVQDAETGVRFASEITVIR